MSTTNIFAELIVIGLGAFAVLALLVVAVLGVNRDIVAFLATSSVAAIPVLAFVYLLGIVTDKRKRVTCWRWPAFSLVVVAQPSLSVEREIRWKYAGTGGRR